MNKVVALLGIIVLITLGGLLFCAGFFTGTTMSPNSIVGESVAEGPNGDKLSVKKVEDVIDPKTATMSEKIMGMLSIATGNISDTLARKASRSSEQNQSDQLLERSNMTVDSLLREIAARHPIEDECTYKETITRMREGRREAEKRLRKLDGQKIVFIGYFKNRVALQIQKLLISRGYKAHVEISKTGDGQESFIFCGPFKKEKYAQVLLEWLLKHDFSEARIISVTKEVSGQSLYESISGDSSMPINIERAENENDLADDLDDASGAAQTTGQQQIQGQNVNVQPNVAVPNIGVAANPAVVVPNNPVVNPVVRTPTPIVLPTR